MPEQGQGKDDSVFDFLYADHDRIGLYMSQLNQFGNLTSLVRTTEASDKKTFEGKIPTLVGMGSESASRNAGTKTYDPRWTQCLAFLDELQERDMISRSMTDVGIGQFVLCSGDLAVVDIGGMQRLLKYESVQGLARKGANPVAASQLLSKAQRRQSNRSGNEKPTEPKDEMSAAFDILGEVSHAVHARMSAGESHLWCTFKADCMVMSPADVMLKYGVLVAGTWHLLGILDAVPDAPDDQLPTLEKMFAGAASSPFLLGSAILFTQMRLLLGRPANCYGITPLAVFRQIER